jgi:Domain of unknown function (DUF1707)
MTRIRYARREGRLPRTVCDARLEAASQAVTTTDLARLISDLGTYEEPHSVRTMAVALILVIVGAAWEPVALSGRWWLVLAVPVTLIASLCLWAVHEHLR